MVGTWLKRNVDDSGDIGVNKLGGVCDCYTHLSIVTSPHFFV